MRRRFMNESKIAFDYNNYMTIEALEDNVEISLTRVSEYGINGIGWTKYKNKIVVNSGDFVSIKDILNKGESYGHISINGKCNIHGNCNSLIFGDYASGNNNLSEYNNCFRWLLNNNGGVQEVDSNFLPATTLADYCYQNMFENCTSLTTAPELPATTLADYCYYNMFYGCTSLTTAPKLLATTLTSGCYYYMFEGCTSLTTAPSVLPATTLADYCYSSMFYGCTSLTTAPELPATNIAYNCYNSMFWGCTGLTTAPELPATTLAFSCYNNMFWGCTGLTTAPELPATTLADSCYQNMFRDCTALTTAPALPATTLANRCYDRMFSNCTNLTTAPELPATTLADYCYEYMFNRCSSLTTAPELPATTLAYHCYYSMFYGCKKLNYIKMLATDISASECLNNWVIGVASTGTFVKNPTMTTLQTGINGIPSGWTVVNDGEESGGNLITFTIDGTEYQAEEGMTWGEWVDSEYSVTGNFFIDLDNTICYDVFWVGTEEYYVYTTDIIQENYNYWLVA